MKKTCPAKTRMKTDTIEFFFQEDPSMRLASRWSKGVFCQITKDSFEFLSFNKFFGGFAVFCQIIMGSPEGRSVTYGIQQFSERIGSSYYRSATPPRAPRPRSASKPPLWPLSRPWARPWPPSRLLFMSWPPCLTLTMV